MEDSSFIGPFTLFYGAVVTPVSGSRVSYKALPNALLCVSQRTGVIEWIVEDVHPSALQETLAARGIIGEYVNSIDLVHLKTGEFLMPGLVDTHTHAPQMPNVGSGQEHELLGWLQEVTFPTESQFKDLKFARKAYASAVRRIIDNGTTTCCYYGTLHTKATKVLADIVHGFGQRALVGKCNMDRNSPDYCVESSAAASIADTKEVIAHIDSLPSPGGLVKPVLTPRFAISCTPELLTGLGNLAATMPQLAIQTHISENLAEVQATEDLFPPDILPNHPDKTTYAGVYDAYGLLKSNTILAHGVHLRPDEMDLIKQRNSGISHCPASNFNLRSGWAKVGALLDKGIKVGLGTDVSGGFSPSILTAVQHASIASKVVALTAPEDTSSQQFDLERSPPQFANRQLPIATLFYLATLGGAEVCNLEKRVGTLEQGKEFDALVVSVRDDAGNPNLWGADLDLELGRYTEIGPEQLRGLLERFLFCGDDRNVKKVYVRGKLIGGKGFARVLQ